MSVREDLDHRIDSGHPPSFVHIKCTDVPLFTGKLKETNFYYQNLCMWPQVALGMYRDVLVILDVKRI